MLTYCAYQGCCMQRVPCSKTTFFAIPKDERRRIWIENSGNPELKALHENAIKYFCENHFHSKMIRHQFSRSTLHKSAVPIPYSCIQDFKKTLPTENHNKPVFRNLNSDIHTLNKDASAKHHIINGVEQIQKVDYVTTESHHTLAIKINEYSNITKTKVPTIPQKQVDIRSSNLEKSGQDLSNLSDNDRPISVKRSMNPNSAPPDSIVSPVTKRSKTYKRINLNTDASSSGQETIAVDQIEEEHCQNDLQQNITSANTERNNENSKDQSNELHIPKQQVFVASANESPPEMDQKCYQEDMHFALSLVGYFSRLPHRKKVLAKLKVIQFLTELELNECSNIL